MKKVEIVQFENGKYAIRKYRNGNHACFLDLKREYKYWWPKDSNYFKDCLADTTERFEEVLRLLDERHHTKLIEELDAKDMGTVINTSRRSGMSELPKPKQPKFRFGLKWFTD